MPVFTLNRKRRAYQSPEQMMHKQLNGAWDTVGFQYNWKVITLLQSYMHCLFIKVHIEVPHSTVLLFNSKALVCLCVIFWRSITRQTLHTSLRRGLPFIRRITLCLDSRRRYSYISPKLCVPENIGNSSSVGVLKSILILQVGFS